MYIRHEGTLRILELRFLRQEDRKEERGWGREEASPGFGNN